MADRRGVRVFSWIVTSLLLMEARNGQAMGGCKCERTTITGDLGFVSSPKYPRNYPNNCDCTYTIRVPSPYRVQITFTTIDLVGRCDQDYIRVFDTDRSTRLATLCSTTTEPSVVVAQGSQVWITFTSDRRNSASGFQASYLAVLPTTTVAMTTSGTMATTTLPPRMRATSLIAPMATTLSTSSPAISSTRSPTTVTETTPTMTSSTTIRIRPGSTVASTHSTETRSNRTTVTPANQGTKASTTDEALTNEAERQTDPVGLGLLFGVIAGIVFAVLLITLIVACCLRKRRSAKSSPERVAGSRPIGLTRLTTSDPTVIVNRTYQSSDDIIPESGWKPNQGDTYASADPQNVSHSDDTVYNVPEELSKPPVYEISHSTGNMKNPRTGTTPKYTKVKPRNDKGIYPPGEFREPHGTSPGDSEYGYAEFGVSSSPNPNPDPSSPDAHKYDYATRGIGSSETQEHEYAKAGPDSPTSPNYEYADRPTDPCSPGTPGYTRVNNLAYHGEDCGKNRRLDDTDDDMIAAGTMKVDNPGYVSFNKPEAVSDYQPLRHGEGQQGSTYSELVGKESKQDPDESGYMGYGSGDEATPNPYQPLGEPSTKPIAGTSSARVPTDHDPGEPQLYDSSGYQQLNTPSSGVGDDRDYSQVSQRMYQDGYMVPNVLPNQDPENISYDVVSSKFYQSVDDVGSSGRNDSNSDVYDVVASSASRERVVSNDSEESKYYQPVGNPKRAPSDVYDVVNDRPMKRHPRDDKTVPRGGKTSETYEELGTTARPSDHQEMGDAGYTEYNAKGAAPYQDLKPNTISTGRKF